MFTNHLTKAFHKTSVIFLAFYFGSAANALHMTEMPKERQTQVKEPIERRISLKLPLKQPDFHWTFLSEEDFLYGKLLLRIVRGEKAEEIEVFEGGVFADGWQPIPLEMKGGGEIYFGFESTRKYLTAPGDRLELELAVIKDLEGIGPETRGILPAGHYTSIGKYSGLLDEYDTTNDEEYLAKHGKLDQEKQKGSIKRLKDTLSYKAFLECWEDQWPLRITGDQGWLSKEEAAAFKQMMEKAKEEESKLKHLEAAIGKTGTEVTDQSNRIEALKEVLKGQDEGARTSAGTELMKSGQPAIPALVEVLLDEQLGILPRMTAATNLGLMVVNKKVEPNLMSNEAVPALLKVIKDQATPKSGQAAGGKEDEQPFSSPTDGDRLSLSFHCSLALGEIGEGAVAAIPELIKLLSHDDAGFRPGPAIALGMIGPSARSAIPALQKMRDEDLNGTGKNAAEALQKIEGR